MISLFDVISHIKVQLSLFIFRHQKRLKKKKFSCKPLGLHQINLIVSIEYS